MDSIVGKEIQIEKKKKKKEIEWILRFCISKNTIYWCSKNRINGKFKYRIYKSKAPGGMNPYYEKEEPKKMKAILKKNRDLCLVTANLYYIREQEKKTGLQRTDCDLSDVEDYDQDEIRKKEIKRRMEKMKQDKTPYNSVTYPDPNNQFIVEIE